MNFLQAEYINDFWASADNDQADLIVLGGLLVHHSLVVGLVPGPLIRPFPFVAGKSVNRQGLLSLKSPGYASYLLSNFCRVLFISLLVLLSPLVVCFFFFLFVL